MGSHDETEFGDETNELAYSNISIDTSVVTSFATSVVAYSNTTLLISDKSEIHTKSHI
jgi:hypothetical protein